MYSRGNIMATENDIVLIYLQEKPLSFARIEAIEPDYKRGWYHVKMLLLQLPLQVVTWILRDVYINGETFTMDGNPVRLEKVVCPEEEQPLPDTEPTKPPSQNGKVISLADLKKNDPNK
jgi:hypothetical protein